MEWEPSERDARVSCAELPDRLTEPSEVSPSKKVTFPVGVPLDEDWTEAVSVTACPKPDGFVLEATAIVVEAWLTVCVSAAEVLPEKFVSPLYFAVIECEPADKLESESCAASLETVAVPKDVVPSRNVIVPVALPPKAV